jgi:hypothetical protein
VSRESGETIGNDHRAQHRAACSALTEEKMYTLAIISIPILCLALLWLYRFPIIVFIIDRWVLRNSDGSRYIEQPRKMYGRDD